MVKYFRLNDGYDLERAINDWLSQTPNIIIKDIKYSACCEDNYVLQHALIIYERS